MFRKKTGVQELSSAHDDHELARIVTSNTQTEGQKGNLPVYNHKVTQGVHPDGESGRRGFHPGHFLHVLAKSSCKLSMLANLLWPVVPAAIATASTVELSLASPN